MRIRQSRSRGIGRGRHGNQVKGSAHPNWTGGRSVTVHGYVRVLVGKDHPLADSNGRAYEHLVVLYDAGIRLGPDETTHHINGDKTDNRRENLEVLNRADHARVEVAKRGRDRFGQFPPGGVCPCCGRPL